MIFILSPTRAESDRINKAKADLAKSFGVELRGE
jgi:hypothetical protein